MKSLLAVGLVAAAALTAACGGQPGEQGLRDSFAQQLAANKFVKEFQRNLNEMTFVGPGPEGGAAKWRVQMDSAVVEPNDDPALPYKGTVKSSWFADGQKDRARRQAVEPAVRGDLERPQPGLLGVLESHRQQMGMGITKSEV